MKAKRKAVAPERPPPPPDTVGELLVAKGFVYSVYLLDTNHGLGGWEINVKLPPPWNLPSRAFKFPIEVSSQYPDGSRKIGLVHPRLVDHPWVKEVAAALPFPIDPNGGPNEHGYSKAGLAKWWHACDLIEGHWRELLETRQFTTDHDIMHAVSYGLDYGKLSLDDAREILRRLKLPEPADRRAGLKLVRKPAPCPQEKGPIHWPINDKGMVSPGHAWARIHGIEAGWFGYDRKKRFLQWTERGRQMYGGAALDTGYAADEKGQLGFLF